MQVEYITVAENAAKYASLTLHHPRLDSEPPEHNRCCLCRLRAKISVVNMPGAAAGVGSLIGPAIGGLLATINYNAPFLAAAGLLLLTLVCEYFLLPESLEKEYRITSIAVSELNPLKQLESVFRWANLRWLHVYSVGAFSSLCLSFVHYCPRHCLCMDRSSAPPEVRGERANAT